MIQGFLSGSVVKKPHLPCRSHRRCGFNPGFGKIPLKEGMATHFYSCLENPIDRGAWQATVYGVAKS